MRGRPMRRWRWRGALVAAAVASAALAVPAAAAPPQPTYATATVDGDASEWSLVNDHFADMHRAGDPDKPVESKLYLRYDCGTQTLYALVLAEPLTSKIDAGAPDDSFVKLGNSTKLVDGNDAPPDGTQPEFAWVGDVEGWAEGWEASASLPPGSYPNLNVHTLVELTKETSAVPGRAIPLEIVCDGAPPPPPPPPPPTPPTTPPPPPVTPTPLQVTAPPAAPVLGTPTALRAALRVDKRGPARATAGQVVTYAITVRNVGPATATGVVLRDVLPSGYTLSRRVRGATFRSGRLTWNVGTLRRGASRTVTVRFRIARSVAGRRCNVALASAPGVATVRDTVCTRIAAVARAVQPAVTG